MKENLLNSKKIILLIVAIILIIAIIAVSIVIINNNKKNLQPQTNNSDIASNNNEEFTPSIEQNIYSVNDYNLTPEEQNKIIKNAEDLKNYLTSIYSQDNLEEILAKYNEDFFAERALALAYVKLSNNKQVPNIDSLNINENNLEIGYSVKETDKEATNCYIILVETDQTIENVTNVQL